MNRFKSFKIKELSLQRCLLTIVTVMVLLGSNAMSQDGKTEDVTVQNSLLSIFADIRNRIIKLTSSVKTDALTKAFFSDAIKSYSFTDGLLPVSPGTESWQTQSDVFLFIGTALVVGCDGEHLAAFAISLSSLLRHVAHLPVRVACLPQCGQV